jgi:hypothetical protein
MLGEIPNLFIGETTFNLFWFQNGVVIIVWSKQKRKILFSERQLSRRKIVVFSCNFFKFHNNYVTQSKYHFIYIFL